MEGVNEIHCVWKKNYGVSLMPGPPDTVYCKADVFLTCFTEDSECRVWARKAEPEAVGRGAAR